MRSEPLVGPTTRSARPPTDTPPTRPEQPVRQKKVVAVLVRLPIAAARVAAGRRGPPLPDKAAAVPTKAAATRESDCPEPQQPCPRKQQQTREQAAEAARDTLG